MTSTPATRHQLQLRDINPINVRSTPATWDQPQQRGINPSNVRSTPATLRRPSNVTSTPATWRQPPKRDMDRLRVIAAKRRPDSQQYNVTHRFALRNVCLTIILRQHSPSILRWRLLIGKWPTADDNVPSARPSLLSHYQWRWLAA